MDRPDRPKPNESNNCESLSGRIKRCVGNLVNQNQTLQGIKQMKHSSTFVKFKKDKTTINQIHRNHHERFTGRQIKHEAS